MGLNIIIVGGGIAGLAIATALRKEHHITVLERSSGSSEAGAAITSMANSTRVLEAWNFDFQRAGAISCAGMVQHNNKGDELVRVAEHSAQKFGKPMYTLHRQCLHQELLHLATTTDGPSQPAKIIWGAKVQSADVDSGTVTYDDGKTITGDLVIGADGVKSVMRDHVNAKHIDLRNTGIVALRCLIAQEKIEAEPLTAQLFQQQNRILSFVGQGVSLITYPCTIDSKAFLNVAIMVDEAFVKHGVELRPGVYEAKYEIADLLELVKDFIEPIKKLIQMSGGCSAWQLYDLDPLQTWYKGRTVLAGDASHAMTPFLGQGGAMAIEDAEALALVLSGVTDASQLPDRLAQYQSLRKTRAETVRAYTYNAPILRDRNENSHIPGLDHRTPGLSPAEVQNYCCGYKGAAAAALSGKTVAG